MARKGAWLQTPSDRQPLDAIEGLPNRCEKKKLTLRLARPLRRLYLGHREPLLQPYCKTRRHFLISSKNERSR
jgi:hypothetical protein